MKEILSSTSLISRLKAVLLKQRIVLFSAGLLTTVAVIAAIAIGFSLLANVMILPVWLKIALLAAAGMTTVYFFARYALVRLFRGNVDQVAVRLEEKHPDLKGRLIAAVQFVRMKDSPGYSHELIQITERQALKEAGLINFNEVVSYFPVLRTSRLVGIAAVVAVALLFMFPGLFSYSYEVYSNPTTEVAPPLAYSVVPTPASGEWVKYRDIEIGASVFGLRLPEVAYIHYRLADGQWQKSKVDLKKLNAVSNETGDSLAFAITLRQINKSFDYYVEAGRIKTEMQKIDVVDRPRVNDIQLSIFYPDYTGLPPSTINENNGSFSAVVGSRVNMKVESNLPVEHTSLVFDDSSRIQLKSAGKTAEASLVVDKSRSYYIELLDHLGEKNPDPIQYYITAVPDEYPSVEVLYPGFNVNLTEDMLLPLKVHIYDDYGFSSLVLKYTIVAQGRPADENVAVIHYPEKIKTEGEVEFNWDLNQFALYPGDYVVYYFEIADNDRISGPKISKSRQYIARLPSLDEMIAQTDQESRQRISETENLIKSGKDLAERLKQAVRKFEAESRRGEKSDWQQQKELESIADKNAEMMKQVDQMADKMQSSLDKMQDNALMSREIMEKLQEIQKLFEEVATPEMKEAQRQLQEALKNMDRDKLEQALKDFEMSQQELLDRLERTLALLKKLQVEQKMEAMVRKAEQLVERQGQVNDQTESGQSEQLPKLSKSEEEIKASLDGLKKDVDDLNKLLEEAKMQDSEEARKFSEAVKNSTADQNMQQMSQLLQQQKKDPALNEGQQSRSKLLDMLDQMREQQMAMKNDQGEELKQAMKRAIDDANQLSKDQEDLLRRAAEMSAASMTIRDLARSQQDIENACSGLRNTLSELGKASPFLANEMSMLMDQTIKSMEAATGQLDSRRGPAAVQQQRDAMARLNRVSLRLMESLEKQSQCQNPNNCNSGIAKLESLCNKQNNLNTQTQKQCNNPKMSSEAKQQMRAGMERLAGEQAAIRKSMQELEKEFGNSRQVLGRLSDIADEMKKVEEELANGEAGQHTTERQLQIYSRMLEATRSLQRKDYTNQRQATTAKENIYYVPPALSSEILNDQTKIEDRLRQYLGDDYPAQYEEQIKAYFRALLQLQYQNSPEQP